MVDQTTTRFILAPLDKTEVRAMQAREKATATTKVNFFAEKTPLLSDITYVMHLSLKEKWSTQFCPATRRAPNQQEHLIWTRSNIKELCTPCSSKRLHLTISQQASNVSL